MDKLTVTLSAQSVSTAVGDEIKCEIMPSFIGQAIAEADSIQQASFFNAFSVYADRFCTEQQFRFLMCDGHLGREEIERIRKITQKLADAAEWYLSGKD